MIKFDIEKAVRERKSVRSYEERALNNKDRERIKEWIAEITETTESSEPFSAPMRIRLLTVAKGTDTEKLGTYGVIRGVKEFLAVTVKNTENAPETVGYHFERLVLAATSIGLGTCWLAGTFNREQFAEVLDVKDDEIFPIVCPIGYPQNKQTIINRVFRKASKSDQRKDWNELFFENEFGTPLSKEHAGEYAFPLEMLRLAPSAANRQPWRIVMKDNHFHFYRMENLKSKYSYDLPRLDVGIGACHFHMAAQERMLGGEFTVLSDTGITTPDQMKYLFSWIMR